MTGESERFKALPSAFWMALLLAGATEAAEATVLDGIATLESDRIPGDSLLLAAASSVIHRRVRVPEHSEALSSLRAALRRLFLLAPNYDNRLALRVLIGMNSQLCSGILHLSIHKVEDKLYTALQELAYVETWDITRCNSVHPAHHATVDPCTSRSGVSAWPPAR
jgi:hypothetical protein